jgi:diguanylate cyclase (GGDEF)-like protein
MKHTKNYTLQNVVLALLAPILFMAIYLSANNALSTYVDGEKSRQLSAWSVLQLYKEMRKVNFQSELYINDMGSDEALKVSYEILWSRIPLVHERLLNDQILATSKETGLNTLLAAAFIHIKSIEPMIVNEAPLDKRHLTQWMMTTKQYSDSISMSLLHDLISTDSEYSKTLRNNIIKAAGLLLLSTLSVILYLGYLLFTLWVQRKHHQYLLDHDSLTGLFSRDYTMNLLKSHCEKKTPFTLLSFDVNKFKSINDTLGHMAGDDLLKHLATISNKSLGQHGSVGRIGGDEFFCIAETEDLQDINDCYANFLKLLEKPCSIQGYPAYLHVSTGGCFITDCDFNINLLLERVDEAMYRAKKISQEGIFWYGNPIKGEKPVAKLVVG